MIIERRIDVLARMLADKFADGKDFSFRIINNEDDTQWYRVIGHSIEEYHGDSGGPLNDDNLQYHIEDLNSILIGETPIYTYDINDDTLCPPNSLYPQDQETDEFRFFDWDWLIRLAEGLTAGNVKHPGATWKQIPAEEHACRAVRHLVKWLKGDRSEPHLINAGMRVMMAFVTSRERGEE